MDYILKKNIEQYEKAMNGLKNAMSHAAFQSQIKLF